MHAKPVAERQAAGTRRRRTQVGAHRTRSTRATPITDGPISPWHSQVMTVSGTMTATGVLMVILLAAAAVGWSMGPRQPGDVRPGSPAWRSSACSSASPASSHRTSGRSWPSSSPRSTPRRGFLPRCRLQGVRELPARHRRAGHRRHARRVRRDADPLPHADHQGHRQVPPDRHHRNLRADAVLPRLVRHPSVRRCRLGSFLNSTSGFSIALQRVRRRVWRR